MGILVTGARVGRGASLLPKHVPPFAFGNEPEAPTPSYVRLGDPPPRDDPRLADEGPGRVRELLMGFWEYRDPQGKPVGFCREDTACVFQDVLRVEGYPGIAAIPIRLDTSVHAGPVSFFAYLPFGWWGEGDANRVAVLLWRELLKVEVEHIGRRSPPRATVVGGTLVVRHARQERPSRSFRPGPPALPPPPALGDVNAPPTPPTRPRDGRGRGGNGPRSPIKAPLGRFLRLPLRECHPPPSRGVEGPLRRFPVQGPPERGLKGVPPPLPRREKKGGRAEKIPPAGEKGGPRTTRGGA